MTNIDRLFDDWMNLSTGFFLAIWAALASSFYRKHRGSYKAARDDLLPAFALAGVIFGTLTFIATLSLLRSILPPIFAAATAFVCAFIIHLCRQINMRHGTAKNKTMTSWLLKWVIVYKKPSKEYLVPPTKFAESMQKFRLALLVLFVLIQVLTMAESFGQLSDQHRFDNNFSGKIYSLRLNQSEVSTIYAAHFGKQNSIAANDAFQMHIDCRGSGNYTVLLDAGLPFFSLCFALISELAGFQVCSFDRLGYGWSSPLTVSQTSVDMSIQLNALLTAARVPTPFIYVGWSFGGINAQVYNALYPNKTLGLVLVDSMQRDVFMDDKDMNASVSEGVSSFNTIKFLSPFGFPRLLGGLDMLPEACGYPQDSNPLPAQAKEALSAIFLNSTAKFYDAAYHELDGLHRSVSQLSALLTQAGESPFQDKPVAVISATENYDSESVAQLKLLKLSKNTIQIFANHSDHFVMYHNPQAIVQGIHWVINHKL